MKLKHIIIKERGQAMVEFALVLPILLLFIGGIIDFGWIFHNQLEANNASREAARQIAIRYYYESMDNDDAKAKALEIIGDYTKLTDVKIINENIKHDDDEDDDDNEEKITIDFTGKVKILTPILSAFIDKDGDGMFLIESKTTMRVEN